MGDDKNSRSDNQGGCSGELLTFPGGDSIHSDDIGAGYIVSQGGQIPTPEIIDPKLTAKEYREREGFVQSDTLVQTANNGGDARDMMTGVIQEISVELANLKWERQKAAKEGRNTANYTSSRIASLRQLADVLLKRQENMRMEQLDLKSERFQNVLKLWMEFVYTSMQKAGLADHEIDLVFNTMKADMVDWERQILDTTG